MDPITTTFSPTVGRPVLADTNKFCLEKLFGRPSRQKNSSQIEKTAEKMTQAASSKNVCRFDKKYQAISGARLCGAARKAAPKRRVAFEKAAPKRVVV